MIRRTFIRALSGAILTTLLGVKAWRLEADEEIPAWDEASKRAAYDSIMPTQEWYGNKFPGYFSGPYEMYIPTEYAHILDADAETCRRILASRTYRG